ncbi:MAG: SRPBCC family protein [Candidatus Omnitrophica bacterium]|nr:SRPBCC family protein [Candidatus Omnitrophota bacterium]
MELTHAPIARAEMLIRQPVSEVFEAFIDPAITSKFWFTKGSGRLEPGKQIKWQWEMYDFSVQVHVKAIEPNKRILIEWSVYGAPTTVEWTFTPRPDNTTFVSITNSGFSGSGDEIVKQASDSTGGFALVLSGLKALLEHNVMLHLVADRFPDGHGNR